MASNRSSETANGATHVARLSCVRPVNFLFRNGLGLRDPQQHSNAVLTSIWTGFELCIKVYVATAAAILWPEIEGIGGMSARSA